MIDDFASDSDASNIRTERVAVKGEDFEREYRREHGEGSTASSEEPVEFEEWKKWLHPSDKLLFMRLPEPMTEVETDFEDIMDSLDYADPMLRLMQAKIRGLRNYLAVVEREECTLLQSFKADVVDEEERTEFERRLADLRDRRAKLRGLLYDAIMERDV
jgi:hypothetical protein